MPVVRYVLIAAVLTMSCGMLPAEEPALPTLIVEAASGRQFQGEMDAASGPARLVLRTMSGGITLRRPIAWERIVEASIGGEIIDLARLRQRAIERSATAADAHSRQSAVKRRIELRGQPLPDMPAELPAPPNEPAVAAPAAIGPLPQVATLSLDAYIANWDGDVETDGLVVEILPLDADGRIVPVGATVEIELFAPQRQTLDLAPQSGGDVLSLVERWRQSITADDIGPRGARLRLPYGAIHPELRPDWTASWYGLVHVRLTIPGQGVFEESRDGVRIRPYAPNRDNLEMNTGGRFLPTETLGRRQ